MSGNIEDPEDPNVSDDGRSVTSCAPSTYRVYLDDRPGKVCKTCGSSPQQKSPLAKAHSGDQYGGCRPWAKYTKCKSTFTKMPCGHFCLICFNTYRALPESLTIPGGMGVFAKHLFEQMDRVHAFRRSVHYWIKSHNEACDAGTPGVVRLKNRKGLEEAQTLKTNSIQGMRHKQRMTFIEIAKYRKDFGEPSDNGHQVTSQSFDGVVKEGVFVSHDKDGYHEFEAYQDTNVSLETTIDDGKTMLSASQVQDKFDIATKSFKTMAKRRRDASGSVNLQALLDVAKQQHTQPSPSGMNQLEEIIDSEDEKASGSDSDISLGGSLAMKRQLQDFSAPCSKATKRNVQDIPAHSGSSTKTRQAQSSTSRKRLASPATSERSASVCGPKRTRTTPDDKGIVLTTKREVADLDGRCERVMEGVNNSLGKIEHDIESVMDLHGLEVESLSALADPAHSCHAAMKTIQSRCSGVMNLIRETLTRIDRSRCKLELAEQAQQLRDQHKSCKCSYEIMKLLSTSKPHSSSLVAALEEAPKLGIKLRASMCCIWLECKIKHHLEMEQYETLCDEVLSTKTIQAALVITTCDDGTHQQKLQDTACRAIEEGIMWFFRAMKDIKIKDRTSLHKSLVKLCSAIARTRGPSLIDGLRDDSKHVLRIVDADQCDLVELEESVTLVENLKGSCDRLLLCTMSASEWCEGFFESAKRVLLSRQGEMALLKTMGILIDDLKEIVAKAAADDPQTMSLTTIGGYIEATQLKEAQPRVLAAKQECRKLKCCATKLAELHMTWSFSFEGVILSAFRMFHSCKMDEMSSSEVSACHKKVILACTPLVSSLLPGPERTGCFEDLRVFEAMGVLSHSFVQAMKAVGADATPAVIQDALRPFHAELRTALGHKAAIIIHLKRVFMDVPDVVDARTTIANLLQRAETSIEHAEKASHLLIVASFKELVQHGDRPDLAALVQHTDRAIQFANYDELDIVPFLALRSLVLLRWDLEPMFFLFMGSAERVANVAASVPDSVRVVIRIGCVR